MAQILKEEVRERILNAAAEQLLRSGEAATMRQIAQAAGITPGNLYRYYAGKDELVMAIIQPLVEGIDQVLREATGQALTLGQEELPPIPNESLEQLLRQWFYPLMRKVLVQTVVLCAKYPQQAAILMRMRSAGDRLIDWFRQVLEQALIRLVEPNEADRSKIQLMADAECQAFCSGVAILLERCGNFAQGDAERMIEEYLYMHVEGLSALLRRAEGSGIIRLKKEKP